MRKNIETHPVLKYLNVQTFAFLYLSGISLPLSHEKGLIKNGEVSKAYKSTSILRYVPI